MRGKQQSIDHNLSFGLFMTCNGKCTNVTCYVSGNVVIELVYVCMRVALSYESCYIQ